MKPRVAPGPVGELEASSGPFYVPYPAICANDGHIQTVVQQSVGQHCPREIQMVGAPLRKYFVARVTPSPHPQRVLPRRT